jgi:hypothetical protein
MVAGAGFEPAAFRLSSGRSCRMSLPAVVPAPRFELGHLAAPGSEPGASTVPPGGPWSRRLAPRKLCGSGPGLLPSCAPCCGLSRARASSHRPFSFAPCVPMRAGPHPFADDYACHDSSVSVAPTAYEADELGAAPIRQLCARGEGRTHSGLAAATFSGWCVCHLHHSGRAWKQESDLNRRAGRPHTGLQPVAFGQPRPSCY